MELHRDAPTGMKSGSYFVPNPKQPGPWTLWMDNARKLIETVFSSLTRKGHLVLGQLNSFRSVRAKVCRKIAAHNFVRWLGL